MSFLLRFIKVLLQSWWAGKSARLMEASLIHLRVWPNDLDLNVHVNNGRYLTLMDLGRMDLMLRSGAMRLWFGHGWQPLVGLSMARHFKALKVFQAFTLSTRLLGWDAKWIYFEQRFESKGQLYCLGVVKGLMAGKQGPVPTETLLKELKFEGASPELPAYVKSWLEAEASAIALLKSQKNG